MRVFALSDVHADYPENLEWLLSINDLEYRHDVLILAGDISHDMLILRRVFKSLAGKFRDVLFVPGNHELWVAGVNGANGVNGVDEPEFRCSLEKFYAVLKLCEEEGIRSTVCHYGGVSLIPLFSWYDFSFGEPDRHLLRAWRDFRACRWPRRLDSVAAVSTYFLQKNLSSLEISNEIVISCSHFLPRIDVMPAGIPEKRRKVYPVLGSTGLGEQVMRLNPDIHVYGHSHVNQLIELENTVYVNNAFAYPGEGRIARKRLHCVLDQAG